MSTWIDKLKSPHHLRQQIGGVFFLGLILLPNPALTPFEKSVVAPAAAAVFCAGLWGRIWSSGFLVKNDALTTTGPYGFVRNPIYVSNLLIGLGLIFVNGHYWTIALLVIIYGACYVPGMRVEAENLRRRYGEAFEKYAAAVPLFFPKLRASDGYGGDRWKVSAYLDNKEWPVTLGLVIGLAAVLWRRGVGQ